MKKWQNKTQEFWNKTPQLCQRLKVQKVWINPTRKEEFEINQIQRNIYILTLVISTKQRIPIPKDHSGIQIGERIVAVGIEKNSRMFKSHFKILEVLLLWNNTKSLRALQNFLVSQLLLRFTGNKKIIHRFTCHSAKALNAHLVLKAAKEQTKKPGRHHIAKKEKVLEKNKLLSS